MEILKMHHSMIGMLMRCPMQFYYRYIEGLKEIPGIGLIIGTQTHKSAERDFLHKIETEGRLLPDKQIGDLARDGARFAFESEEILYHDDEKSLGIVKVQDAAVDQTVALCKLHHAELAPIIDPLAVEEKFVLKFRRESGEYFPYEFHGTKDLITEPGVRDLKTAGKSPTKDPEGGYIMRADHWFQGLGYTLSEFYERDHKMPDIFGADYLVKLKTPKLIRTAGMPTRAMLKMYRGLIHTAYETIRKEAFPPNINGWWCTKRYCGYWENTCPYGRRGRVMA